jgi:hypothetical protein
LSQPGQRQTSLPVRREELILSISFKRYEPSKIANEDGKASESLELSESCSNFKPK